MDDLNGRSFVCSWSGGKDSTLALHHAIRRGGVPKYLFTMMAENNENSRSHNLPRALLEEQARSLGIPLVMRAATWNDYEEVFLAALREFKAEGITAGVFGDIDVVSHREWVERVCATADIVPFETLWQRPRRELLMEFIALGFKATVVVTNTRMLPARFLGKNIDPQTIIEMEHAGIDASGELGEYHTVATAGPLFSNEIVLQVKGLKLHEDHAFLIVS